MIDGVLPIAFGGPTAPSEIRPFLANVTRGRRIPPARIEEVARHYEAMPGGRSPLNDVTFGQARALSAAVEGAGLTLPVFVGMRNWRPYLSDTLATMAAAGLKRALGVILSVLRTEASWDRYVTDVAEARAQVPAAPEVVFAPAWAAHPRFLDAAADRCRDALAGVPADVRARTPLVFTAHSVPVAMAEASPYVAEFEALARAIAARVAHDRWTLAYQSRSGSPGEPWLEPDVNDVLGDLARQGERRVVVAPVGFVADHVEVLYDLDVEARKIADDLGLALHRARTVNDHPEFIAALAEVVRAHATGAGGPSATTLAATRGASSSARASAPSRNTRLSARPPRPGGSKGTPRTTKSKGTGRPAGPRRPRRRRRRRGRP